MIKKSTARATMLGISAVTALTVLSGAMSWDTTLAMSVSKAQQSKPSVDLKKMKDLYEQVKTGKRLEAAQEFVAQLLKMKTADVNNVLKSLPFKLKETKSISGRSTSREYTSTDGKGLISVHTLGNQFSFQFEVEKFTEPNLKVEFPPAYYVLFEKGQPERFETEEEVNKFKEKNAEKTKEVLHITSWEQGKEQLPEVFNEKGGRMISLSEEQKHLFKGRLDNLKKYGFKEVSGDITISCNYSGEYKGEGIHIWDEKFYPNHELSINFSKEGMWINIFPKLDPNKIDPNQPSA